MVHADLHVHVPDILSPDCLPADLPGTWERQNLPVSGHSPENHPAGSADLYSASLLCGQGHGGLSCRTGSGYPGCINHCHHVCHSVPSGFKGASYVPRSFHLNLTNIHKKGGYPEGLTARGYPPFLFLSFQHYSRPFGFSSL